MSHHSAVEKILFSEQEIAECIERLGKQISKDYEGRDLLMVAVLKASAIFLSDLLRKITIPCEIDFMAVSSYQGRQSSGIVRMDLDLRQDPSGKDVLLIEDILDSGLTVQYILQSLKNRGLRSLKVCTLLDKPAGRKVPLRSDYTGFTIPDHFVIGYGLDFNQKLRNLPYIATLKKDFK